MATSEIKFARGPVHPRSIAVYLFVLALVALVPAFAFSAVLLQRNNQAQERVVETLITGSARSIIQAVDREVFATISTLKILATNRTLQSGDLESFYSQIKQALAGTNTYVFALNSDFYTIFSTRQDYGAAPVRSNDIANDQKALEIKNVVISGLVTSAVTDVKVFHVLFPVFTGRFAPLVLGVSRDAISLQSALLSDKLPDGWNVAIVDPNGIVIAGSQGGGNPGDKFTLADITNLDTTPGLVTLGADGSYRAAVRRSRPHGLDAHRLGPQQRHLQTPDRRRLVAGGGRPAARRARRPRRLLGDAPDRELRAQPRGGGQAPRGRPAHHLAQLPHLRDRHRLVRHRRGRHPPPAGRDRGALPHA